MADSDRELIDRVAEIDRRMQRDRELVMSIWKMVSPEMQKNCSYLHTMKNCFYAQKSWGESGMEHLGFVDKDELARWGEEGEDGDYTEFRVYKAHLSDEEILAKYDYPDGSGRCECSICLQDGDCCGSRIINSVKIQRMGRERKIAMQDSYLNI